MAENLMTIAYENGVNLFDTAEVYASGRSDFTFFFFFFCPRWNRLKTTVSASESHTGGSQEREQFLSLQLILIYVSQTIFTAKIQTNLLK